MAQRLSTLQSSKLSHNAVTGRIQVHVFAENIEEIDLPNLKKMAYVGSGLSKTMSRVQIHHHFLPLNAKEKKELLLYKTIRMDICICLYAFAGEGESYQTAENFSKELRRIWPCKPIMLAVDVQDMTSKFQPIIDNQDDEEFPYGELCSTSSEFKNTNLWKVVKFLVGKFEGLTGEQRQRCKWSFTKELKKFQDKCRVLNGMVANPDAGDVEILFMVIKNLHKKLERDLMTDEQCYADPIVYRMFQEKWNKAKDQYSQVMEKKPHDDYFDLEYEHSKASINAILDGFASNKR